MPNLRGSEWLIIILLVALLFGAKRMPDAARSLGRSLRIFKAETKGLTEGSSAPSTNAAPAAAQASPLAVQASAPAAVPPAAPAPAASAEPVTPSAGQPDPIAPALYSQPPAEA